MASCLVSSVRALRERKGVLAEARTVKRTRGRSPSRAGQQGRGPGTGGTGSRLVGVPGRCCGQDGVGGQVRGAVETGAGHAGPLFAFASGSLLSSAKFPLISWHYCNSHRIVIMNMTIFFCLFLFLFTFIFYSGKHRRDPLF